MKNKKMMATLTCFVVAMAIVGCTSSKSPDTNKQKEATTESVTVEANLENSLTQNNNEQNNYLTTKSKFIEIVCEKEKVLINLNEVMYIERDARKVRFVTKGSEYASYISLASLIKRLPDNFVR